MDASQKIDPEVGAAFAALNRPSIEFSLETLATIREQRRLMPKPELSDAVERSDQIVPGDPPVVLRIHRRKGLVGAVPCIYSIHGGGYVGGSYEGDDARFDYWCQRFDCVGVSVEYRLAPETPYPGPLDDCLAGLRFVHANAEALGVDRERIGIFGASAGAGLASGLTLRLRDSGEIPVRFQLLFYPMCDDRQVTASSQWTDVPIWSPTANRFGWQSYLGELYGSADIPPYAAAARAKDLSGLPSSYIMVGSLDGFLDEDVELATRLTHAGVPTDLHVYPGGPHAFDMLAPQSSISMRAKRDADDWLSWHLADK